MHEPALSLTDQIGIAKDLLTIIGIFIAAVWFFYRWQHGRRAQIDLDCEFYPLEIPDSVLAEIRINVENKGLVRQDIHGFSLSVCALEDSTVSEPNPTSEALRFRRVLFDKHQLDEHDASVRPGVKRLFTYPVVLQAPGHLIQVRVALRYAAEKAPINMVQRVFRTAVGTAEERRV